MKYATSRHVTSLPKRIIAMGLASLFLVITVAQNTLAWTDPATGATYSDNQLSSLTPSTAFSQAKDAAIAMNTVKTLYACITKSRDDSKTFNGLSTASKREGVWNATAGFLGANSKPNIYVGAGFEDNFGNKSGDDNNISDDGTIECDELDIIGQTSSVLGVNKNAVVCALFESAEGGNCNINGKLKWKSENAALSSLKNLYDTAPKRNVFWAQWSALWQESQWHPMVSYHAYAADFNAACPKSDNDAITLSVTKLKIVEEAPVLENNADYHIAWDNSKGKVFYAGNPDGSKAEDDLPCRTIAERLSAKAQQAADFISALYNVDVTTTDVAEGTEEENEEDEPSCWNSSGALGWILCSVIDFLSGIVQSLYENVIQQFLEINVSLFQDQGTYDGWKMFRDFANITFVILLLIVILSQVTGFGIDNYGIKRMLPKIVVAAVLINLSYIICQLAVDVSNILGYGLNNFFDSLNVGDITVTSDGSGESVVTETISDGQKAGAVMGAILAVIATGAVFAHYAAVIVMPLLLALGSAVIAILFMFIILGVRQAAVVLLTVISPLAFACYMLPNTKKFFDRWQKMFVGFLVVFPICGILVGGGNFAGRLLLKSSGSADSFFFQLIAMLLTVVPFFFIPTLLKNTLAGMGNIGAKLSGIGSAVNRGTVGAVKNSEGYKDSQRYKWLQAKSGYKADGKSLTALGKFKRAYGNTRLPFSGTVKRSHARAVGALNKMDEETYGAEGIIDNRGVYLQGLESDAIYQRITNSADYMNENEENLEKEYRRVLLSGNQAEINAWTKALSGKSDTTRNIVKSVGGMKDGNDIFKDNTAARAQFQTALKEESDTWKKEDVRVDQYAKHASSNETMNDYTFSNASVLAKVSGEKMNTMMTDAAEDLASQGAARQLVEEHLKDANASKPMTKENRDIFNGLINTPPRT